jgi:rubredoxin
MSQYVDLSGYSDWTCADCGVPLVPGKVDVSYLGNSFQVELLKCPQCGMVLVPEELALGKMAEVEKELEDK